MTRSADEIQLAFSPRFAGFGLGLLFLLLGPISCGNPPEPPAGRWFAERDFIFISVDTLRADHLPFYGYSRATAGDPNDPFSLAWLADRSQIYEECWAPIGKTLPSLGSFWSGLFPLEHGGIANTTRMQAKSLALKFQEHGYSTQAILANRTLFSGMGLEQGFDIYEIAAKEQEQHLGDRLLKHAAPKIAEKKPLMLWAHWMSPHQPYTPPADLAQSFTDKTEPVIDNDLLYSFHLMPAVLSPQLKEYCIALYDAEVLTASQRIQSFLKGLDQSYQAAGRGGLLDNAVVVFFSDHGEELADRNGYFLHAKSLYSGVLKVPLMIASNGLDAARISEPIALEKVLPWLMYDHSTEQEFFPASWQTEYYTLRKDQWTLVHNPAGNSHGPLEPPVDAKYFYPQVALFDRSKDSNERIDVAKRNPDVVREMLTELDAWYGQLKILDPVYLAGKDPKAERQRLLDLGYISEVPETVVRPWKAEQWKP